MKWLSRLTMLLLVCGAGLAAGCSCDDDDDDDAGGGDAADDDAADDDNDDDAADDDTDDDDDDDNDDDDATPVCTGAEIFCEDWEGDALGAPPAPWVVDAGGASTAAVYEIGTKEYGQGVKVTDEVQDDYVHLRWTNPTPTASGLLVIEFDAVLLAPDFFSFQALDVDGYYEVSAYFWASSSPTNQILAEDNDSAHACGSFTLGEWTHIRMDIDLNFVSYDVQVNGAYGDCASLAWSNASTGPGTIETLDFYGGGAAYGVGAMDNLRVYVPD